MAREALGVTILPQKRSWLRRSDRAEAHASTETVREADRAQRPGGKGSAVPAAPAASAPAGPTHHDDVGALAGLERLAARAPEIAARQASELAWQEEARRKAEEAAAHAAAEQERRLREESLDAAERLASLMEQRRTSAPAGAGAVDTWEQHVDPATWHPINPPADG